VVGVRLTARGWAVILLLAFTVGVLTADLGLPGWTP